MADDPLLENDPLDKRASLTSPVEGSQAVAKSASENLDNRNRLIYIGTGGTFVAVMRDGSTCTLPNIPDSTWIPGRFKNVTPACTCDDMTVFW